MKELAPRGPLIEELSYPVHTGRELEMMLQGRKPLSVFSDLIVDHQCEENGKDEGLEQYVRSGSFVMHEVVETWNDQPTVERPLVTGRRTRLFAMKDEAWRIPAYLLFKRVS
jgi:hypothetical protein